MSDNDGPQMVIMGGSNRGGRPRVEEPKERVSTRLPLDRYDRLVRVANRRGQSVSSLVRDILLAQSFLSR